MKSLDDSARNSTFEEVEKWFSRSFGLGREEIRTLQWNRSNTIGLAKASCDYCNGLGTRINRGQEVPCSCIFRAIFRACYHRFRECAALGSHTSTVTFEPCRGPLGRRVYSRKREEFGADFCLVSRRMLNDIDYKIFRFHYLLGADWKLCCRQTGMDRGDFFHRVYRIEEKLGRIFVELRPYPLYPISEYFGGVVERKRPTFDDREPLPLSA